MDSTSKNLPLEGLIGKKLVHLEQHPMNDKLRFYALTYSIDELMVILQYERRQSVSWWAKKWKLTKIKNGVGYRIAVDEVHTCLIQQGISLDEVKQVLRIKYGLGST